MPSGPAHYRELERLLVVSTEQQAAAVAARDAAAKATGLETGDKTKAALTAKADAAERAAQAARGDAVVHGLAAATAAFALPHVVRLQMGKDGWATALGVDMSAIKDIANPSGL